MWHNNNCIDFTYTVIVSHISPSPLSQSDDICIDRDNTKQAEDSGTLNSTRHIKILYISRHHFSFQKCGLIR